MPGLFGDTEEEKVNNLSLLGLMLSQGINQSNTPGASMGQALSGGFGAAGQGLQQMQHQRALQQMRDLQMKKLQYDMTPKPMSPKDRYTNVPGVGLVDLTAQGGPSVTMPSAGPEDKQLVEIYDAKSPTGTRMVPRADAINQPGKPGNGLSFRTNADGSIELVQGRGAGQGGAFGAPTMNKIDEKLLNSTELLTRLTDTEKQFKPEYLQLGTRVGMAGSRLKDFAGMNLDDASKQELSDYSTFRRSSVNNINRILNELSGAAVSPSEGERLKAAYPNAGIGVFDGDSPTEFKAKMDAATKETRNAILRYNYAKVNGMNPLKTGVELQDVPALVEKRGSAIESEVRKAMPNASPDAIKMETRARLAREFGMGN